MGIGLPENDDELICGQDNINEKKIARSGISGLSSGICIVKANFVTNQVIII